MLLQVERIKHRATFDPPLPQNLDIPNQAKEQIDPNISMLAKANQTYYGKVLQSGAQGTVQNTKDGLVYHPQIQDLKTGKEYTLTYTENQIKILENIEINRKSGKSQDNEIKR